MWIKRKREITVETAEVLIIKTRTNEVRCRECGVSMITVKAAVAATGVSSAEIYRRMEASTLHFAETEGLLLVCPNSLTTDEPERDRKAVAFFRKELRP